MGEEKKKPVSSGRLAWETLVKLRRKHCFVNPQRDQAPVLRPPWAQRSWGTTAGCEHGAPTG